MLEAWLLALEAAPPIEALRLSKWAYPLLNAAHILGIALLVGSVVPLDLRLLGGWRTVPVTPLWTVLGACAATGLALAMITGALLFATQASAYADSGVFQGKLALVAVGVVNALALRLHARSAGPITQWARIAALLSLLCWLPALLLGRLVAYF